MAIPSTTFFCRLFIESSGEMISITGEMHANGLFRYNVAKFGFGRLYTGAGKPPTASGRMGKG